jgi:hypothetical protein
MSCELHSIRSCGSEPYGPSDTPACSAGCPKLAITRRLQELTDGEVTVSFSHNSFFEGDDDAMGHLWYAFVRSEKGEDDFTLDDRRPEPLEVQLVAALRKFARYVNMLADETESRIDDAVMV